MRRWRESHPTDNSDRLRRRYARNPQKMIDNQRRWYRDHLERSREIARLSYHRHADEKRKSKRNLYEEHPEIILSRVIAYQTLKTSGKKRERHCREYIGCSPGFLRNHLESLFQPGMTWENHGEWHVDHIIPLSWFPLREDPSLIFVASHWTNLQPLWAAENLRKSNKEVA